jgi:filamentous hemagglutinin family protein
MMRRFFPLRPFVLFTALASAQLHCVHAAPPLPSGGQFVAGSGSISRGGRSVTIDQTSTRGVVDWRSFSIAPSRTVTFNNGNGATLNRVTGGDPSVILGSLTATGSVYLLNPQGVLIGRGGVVSTGGRFVASSLDIANDAFMAGGPLTLSGGGDGAVINLGRIGSSGGDVFLVSRAIAANRGSIDAPNGAVELAAGAQVLLQDSAGSHQVFVDAGSHGTVTNAGAIRAAQVDLQAADGNVYALAGHHAGIRATGTATRDGHVWLVAEQGAVHASGRVDATNADGSGGTVETNATKLDIGRATVRAGQWNLNAPTFTIDTDAARAISRSLGKGTSVNVVANGADGDLALNGDVSWKGDASLALAAARNVTIAPGAAIGNAGNGNLTVRADAGAIGNGGGIANHGTIDWSGSTGVVSLLYDMNGSYAPGALLGNQSWTAAPMSGRVTQITAYKLVNSLTDLAAISQDLKGNYALGKDIDAKSTATTPVTPIAPTAQAPFAGQFDGFGHVIDGLAITTHDIGVTAGVGLFGVVGKDGVVRNLGLTNVDVSGDAGGGYGPIAGRNDGTVAYAWATGGVGSGQSFGGISGGGLVGVNAGTIERSWSGAGVGGAGSYGGLVYQNDGLIVQSFATGNVNGGGSHTSGSALVQRNNGVIRQSYATGDVNTISGGGGLVGTNSGTGVIEQSFATGAIGRGGSPNTFGAIASENGGTIRNDVYWDIQTTFHPNAVAYPLAGTVPPASNGLTTQQMSNPASFASWEFGPSGVWAMPAGATHPVLQWQVTGQ